MTGNRYIITLGNLTIDESDGNAARATARNHAMFWAEPTRVLDRHTGNAWTYQALTGQETETRSPYDLQQLNLL
jgi:hypothetical protein